MLRVGLTGGIGSGKSAVAERLAALGAVVLDGDKAARAIVEPGTPGLARITETFGPDVLRADGSLDRAKLAGIVFSDETARQQLNEITHPLIHQHILAAERAALDARGPETIVVHDIPLLAEGSGRRTSTRSSSSMSPPTSRSPGWPGAGSRKTRPAPAWRPRRPASSAWPSRTS